MICWPNPAVCKVHFEPGLCSSATHHLILQRKGRKGREPKPSRDPQGIKHKQWQASVQLRSRLLWPACSWRAVEHARLHAAQQAEASGSPEQARLRPVWRQWQGRKSAAEQPSIHNTLQPACGVLPCLLLLLLQHPPGSQVASGICQPVHVDIKPDQTLIVVQLGLRITQKSVGKGDPLTCSRYIAAGHVGCRQQGFCTCSPLAASTSSCSSSCKSAELCGPGWLQLLPGQRHQQDACWSQTFCRQASLQIAAVKSSCWVLFVYFKRRSQRLEAHITAPLVLRTLQACLDVLLNKI